MAKAVHGGRVDPVDAKFEGMAHGRKRSGVVLRPPGKCPAASSHGPRAKTDRGDFYSAPAQSTFWQIHFSPARVGMTFQLAACDATNIMTRFSDPSRIFCAARRA